MGTTLPSWPLTGWWLGRHRLQASFSPAGHLFQLSGAPSLASRQELGLWKPTVLSLSPG